MVNCQLEPLSSLGQRKQTHVTISACNNTGQAASTSDNDVHKFDTSDTTATNISNNFPPDQLQTKLIFYLNAPLH